MVSSGKPFSPASERNRSSIVNSLQPLLVDARSVLEIGSGTGQHAVFFGEHMPHLKWQTSDLRENHSAIRMWIEEAGLPNVRPPLELDVDDNDWPIERFDVVYTANTLHICSWSSVENMFSGVSSVLNASGLFCVYGPFSYDGRHTSRSNADFDLSLRARDPRSGIRTFEQVHELAQRNKMLLKDDQAMPANNRLLVFHQTG